MLGFEIDLRTYLVPLLDQRGARGKNPAFKSLLHRWNLSSLETV
jgi:hypothetical protein